MPKPGDTGGAKIVLDALAERLAETDADVRYETGATNLVVEVGPEGGGAVVGVAWRKYDDRGVIRAKSVVIAAGGFVGNDKMVAEYTPQLGSRLFPLASTYDDGLGIRLGASAGAQLRFMEQAFITAPFYPPAQLVTGIVVNKEGKRFVAEDSYHSRTSGFVMDQPDQAAYLIVDSAHIEHPTSRSARSSTAGRPSRRWSRRSASRRRAGGDARVVQRERGAQGGPRVPQASRLARAAGHRARGAPTTSRSARRCTPASPWAACASRSTARCSARTAR